MGKRLERFGEIRIIDETNGFGLDLSTNPRRGSGTLKKDGFGTCI